MDVSDKIGRYEFLTEPFQCDFLHRLFIGNLGNYLLNSADFHSNDRDFGMNYLNPIHKTWVLSRLSLEMNEIPEAYTKFSIETWVESVMRFFTNRNFKIQDVNNGKVYGYGRSVWAMIDTDTRQPVDILTIHEGAINNYVEPDKECAMAKSSRVKITDNAELMRTIDTNYSDVDMNGHINSVKYIEHILDLWDIEWYKDNRVARFDIAYVAESHCGDKLSFYREQSGEGEYCVRVVKTTSENTDEIEVCRSKIAFVK